jgi:hypothetical protein
LVDEVHSVSDFLNAADLQSLPMLNNLNKIACLHQ